MLTISAALARAAAWQGCALQCAWPGPHLQAASRHFSAEENIKNRFYKLPVIWQGGQARQRVAALCLLPSMALHRGCPRSKLLPTQLLPAHPAPPAGRQLPQCSLPPASSTLLLPSRTCVIQVVLGGRRERFPSCFVRLDARAPLDALQHAQGVGLLAACFRSQPSAALGERRARPLQRPSPGRATPPAHPFPSSHNPAIVS